MASLSQIAEPPAFVTADERAIQQQSTPPSFAPLTPVLRFQLPDTSIFFSPAPSDLPSCFAQLTTQPHADDDEHSVSFARGHLFLTEQELSFLSPESSTGFKLTYPAIALHAVTRSLPSFITPSSNGTSSASPSGCIYCQLDLSTADSDPDDDSAFVEMHIVTPDEISLGQLFDALTQCASLHPSTMPGEDEEAGHPFAGLAPFGRDASGYQLGADDDDEENEGAYEDADGNEEDDAQELSETGRRNLAHLENVMQWPDEGISMTVQGSTSETNTLILSNLPNEFFIPHICSLLLSLLNTYGPMVRWTPLPSVERAIVVFQDAIGAKLAKEGLDRLILPFEDEANGNTSTSSAPAKVERAIDEDDGTILRAVFGPFTDPSSELETLAVPTTDKNFLISPPGSPPVGWEPIREDPPNRDTLADDLMRALADLRDTGSHIASHQPKDWGADGASDMKPNSPGAPEVILAPSTAPPLRTYQPAWRQPTTRDTQHDQEDIEVPGVTVQSFDGDNDSEQHASKMYNGYSISSVKATVDSMRGTSASERSLGLGVGLTEQRSRITPTSRPPLNTEGLGGASGGPV